MEGEYKNLETRNPNRWIGGLIFFGIGLFAFWLIIFYEFDWKIFLIGIVFTLVPIYHYLRASKEKIIFGKEVIEVYRGNKVEEYSYSDFKSVVHNQSLYAPMIELNVNEDGRMSINISNYFKNNIELRKFVDWLKTKNPKIRDEVNWESYFVKRTRF